ncbi:MAG: hypothetical protein ABI837_04495 [Acidobacteriota bacterium]
MGRRYAQIDQQVQKITTRFPTAECVTIRAEDGSRTTTVWSRDGKIRTTTLTPQTESALPPLQALLGERFVSPATTDILNARAYTAWKLGSRRANGLDEESSLPIDVDDVEAEARMPLSVRTETADLVAVSMIVAPIAGRSGLPSFRASLWNKSGELLGSMAWHSAERRLAFQMHDGTAAVISEQAMGRKWPFEPDLAWANIQLLSFERSAQTIEASRQRAGSPLTDKHLRAAPNDTAGCDGLHWLDGSVFRPCCDIHDACYAAFQPACDATSWWFDGSWHCIQCNIAVIECFVIQIVDKGEIFYPIYDDGGLPPNCQVPGWWRPGGYPSCPAWCASCTFY